MSTELVVREFDGKAFEFRADGWINMTKAAKAFGKRIDNFLTNAETQHYILALRAIPGMSGIDPVQAIRGGAAPGTWGHPKLAIFFARWLDVRFAVFCDMVIDDLIRGKAELTVTKPEESAAMALPKDYLSALKQLVVAVEDNQRLQAENAIMADELNRLTADEWRALHHLYLTQGQRIKLGRAARKIADAEGLAAEKQDRMLEKGGYLMVVTLNVFPRRIWDAAARQIGIVAARAA